MIQPPTKTPKQQASLAGLWQGIEAPLIGIALALFIAIQQYLSTHTSPNWGELWPILLPTIVVGIVQALKQFNATLGQASTPTVIAPAVSSDAIAAAVVQQLPPLVVVAPPLPAVPVGGTANVPLVGTLTGAPTDTTGVQPLSISPVVPEAPVTLGFPPMLNLPILQNFPDSVTVPIVNVGPPAGDATAMPAVPGQ